VIRERDWAGTPAAYRLGVVATSAASRIPRAAELLTVLDGSIWFNHVLDVAMDVAAPDWWIGAGAIRDIVWDTRFGQGFEPGRVRDIDLGFFDAADLSAEGDQRIELALRARDPSLPWDAKNQAAVHLWYPRRFGMCVEPFDSTTAAVATFPEVAVCVAVRRTVSGALDLIAPFGLDDLLDGVWRWNPTRVMQADYLARLERKRPQERWRLLVVK
jgi:uncharacterized protein